MITTYDGIASFEVINPDGITVYWSFTTINKATFLPTKSTMIIGIK